mgnify:CR=1 FL=1
MKTKKIPMRRCVGCGESKTKKELIRIVALPSGMIELDRTGKKSGREYISVITWNVLKRPISLMDWKDR